MAKTEKGHGSPVLLNTNKKKGKALLFNYMIMVAYQTINKFNSKGERRSPSENGLVSPGIR